MAHDPDAGLVKRGLALLIVMLLLVCTVLFIVFHRRTGAPAPTGGAAEFASTVIAPAAPYPGSVSWGALQQVSEHLPSPVGWEVRHNAMATLARRGSDRVPWAQYREMLDLNRATANAREQLKDTQESPDGSARALVVAALRAVG